LRSLGMTTPQTALTGETYRKSEVVAVHAMKAYGTVGKRSIHTLTSAMMGWSASSPGCFTVGESVSTSHHTGDCWTGTTTGPDAPYKKNLLLMPGSAPSPPSTNYYTQSRLSRDISLRGHDSGRLPTLMVSLENRPVLFSQTALNNLASDVTVVVSTQCLFRIPKVPGS
jgi:hypothetical protein